MGKRKRASGLDAKAFLDDLQQLLTTLPSQSDKVEARKIFNELIEFLSSLRDSFDSLPSAESSNAVIDAIQRLREMYRRAESNPAIAIALGIHSSTRTRKFKPAMTEEDIAIEKDNITKWDSFSIEQIREQLQSGKYSLSQLHAIAQAVGMKSFSKMSREALAHQITMKIANYRGYRHLSGETHSETSASMVTDHTRDN